jgi:hypothetical protein
MAFEALLNLALEEKGSGVVLYLHEDAFHSLCLSPHIDLDLWLVGPAGEVGGLVGLGLGSSTPHIGFLNNKIIVDELIVYNRWLKIVNLAVTYGVLALFHSLHK